MIYIVDIKNNPDRVAFIFQQKELPESISINSRTKLNTVEYNGGIITNQIIGIYEQPIEWDGCFYGTYPNGQYAKQRADQLKLLLGRPVKIVFAVPTANSNPIPENSLPKTAGHVGVYIIEEYDVKINNYADVDYRIKVVPHVSQSQAKPKAIEIEVIKVSEENISTSANNIATAKPKNPQAKDAQGAARDSQKPGDKAQRGARFNYELRQPPRR
jgi:hypothetical protein